MNDYISREAAKEYVKSQNGRPFICITIGDAFRMMLDEVPAADVVEVVRCGECKHRYVDGDNVRYNVCELNHNRVQSDDWFCADGERKDGADNG